MNEVITQSDIYWISRLDGINMLAVIMMSFSGITAIILAMISIMTKCDGDEEVAMKLMRCLRRIVLPILIVSTLVAVFVPTTKEMCAIKVIPLVTNSQDVQGLGKNVVDLANEWLTKLKPAPEKQ